MNEEDYRAEMVPLLCVACGLDLTDWVYYGYGWKEPQQVYLCKQCYKSERVYNDE